MSGRKRITECKHWCSSLTHEYDAATLAHWWLCGDSLDACDLRVHATCSEHEHLGDIAEAMSAAVRGHAAARR